MTLSTRADEGLETLGSAGAEGDALISRAVVALSALKKLFEHRQLFDPAALRAVGETLDAAERRLARTELHVVVIGERQSGKSTLLDAIAGDRLLGGARGQIGVVTFIRRREAPNYVAKFKSGVTEDFSRDVPDPVPEFTQRAASLEESLAAAKQRCSAARSEFRRAIEAREKAESYLDEAERELDGARRAASTASTEIAGVEGEVRRVDAALAEVEHDVPVALRRKPPRWALWLWILYVVFALLKRRVLARYRRLTAERDAVRSRLLAERGQTTQTADAQAVASARVESLAARVAAERALAAAAEKALRASEHDRDTTSGQLAELGSEREHHEGERRRRFFANLAALGGTERGRELVELAIEYPARLLPSDIVIIDTPGAFSQTAPEWSSLREEVDGCILVSELDRAVSESSKGFLRQLKATVPHVILVLTKVDQAFADAVARGGDDPWHQVEQARRIGTRRFARELGRDPDSVLSIAVAAEVALTPADSELARRFETEVAKLFHLLRRERALILGARAGGAVRRCIRSIGDAEQRAESAYRDTIAELERTRTPMPDAFSRQGLEQAQPVIDAAAREAVECAIRTAESEFSSIGRVVQGRVDACAKRRGLVDLAARLSHELPEQMIGARRRAHIELESGVERGVDAVATKLFEDLRQRYQLLHKIDRSVGSSPRLSPSDDPPPVRDSFVEDVTSAVAAFDRTRYALGAGGLISGAAVGFLVHPWYGAAGAVLGALPVLVRREGGLRARVLGVFTAAISEREQGCVEELRSLQTDAASAIRAATERAVERAIVRFGRWIAEPIEAEQGAIDAEREKLSSLERLRAELADHDAELERLLKAAAEASVGLCR